MKKRSFAIGFLLIRALLVFSQDNHLFESITDPYIVTGKVEKMAVVNDLHGGFYIIYQEDNHIKVLKGNQTRQMVQYNPFPNDLVVTNVRNLTAMKNGFDQFGAFIGSLNGQEHIFIYILTDSGELCVCRDTVDRDGNSGSITRFELKESIWGITKVSYIRNGVLYEVDYPLESDEMILQETLSNLSENVLDYSTLDISSENGMIEYGWYKTETSDNEVAVVLFKRNGNIITQKEHIPQVSLQAQVFMNVSTNDVFNYSIIDGKKVMVFSDAGYGFESVIAFTAPFSVKSCPDLQLLLSGKGLLVCEDESSILVYTMSDTIYGKPVFDKPLFSTEGSFIFIKNIYEKKVDFIYMDTNVWVSVRLDNDTGALTSPLIFAKNAKDILFYYNFMENSEEKLLYIGFDEKFSTFSALSTIKENQDIRDNSLNVPSIEVSQNTYTAYNFANAFYNSEYEKIQEYVLKYTSVGLVQYNTVKKEVQFLPCILHATSKEINNIVLTALYNNDEIVIYTLKRN